jgi:hypothetical protein
VVIESSLEAGNLTWAECVLPGETDEEVLFSTYLCHPSMANNELSGPLAQAFLYEKLAAMPKRRYTYRFLFAPETIGVIAFLAERGVATQEAGYVLAGIGASAAIGALSIGTIVDRTHPAWVIAGVAILATISLTAVATGIGNPAIYFIAMYAGLAGVAPTMAVGVKRLFGVVAYAPIAGLIAPFLLLSAFSGAGTGWLRDHLGSYQPVFGMMAVLCAVSLLAALLLTRRQLAEL